MHVRRGERVVHRRRQRPNRDLDQLVDREREVLGERAIGAGEMGPIEALRDGRPRVRRPDRRQRESFDDEMARPVEQPDDRICLGRDRDQIVVLDELEIAAPGRGDHGAGVVQAAFELHHRRASFESVACSPGDRLGVDRRRARSRAMDAITSGSWIEVATWLMK